MHFKWLLIYFKIFIVFRKSNINIYLNIQISTVFDLQQIGFIYYQKYINYEHFFDMPLFFFWSVNCSNSSNLSF